MATFFENFFLVKKSATFSKYGKGGGGEVAATYGVRASLFLSCFFYFSDKNGTYKLSLSGHSWKKGTFRNQWQSLINSPFKTTIKLGKEVEKSYTPFYCFEL